MFWGGGTPPPSRKQALISIIPKAGKDLTVCSSYKTISVLNTDYKIFTTILAKRLDNIIPELVKHRSDWFCEKHSYCSTNVMFN